ncbi:MAG: hypothetical protein KJZ86_07990 [Caldilineaceae bacterium]|nr:hypothetical protein [Caldilineaceae bacterium]HRJ40277.1 hypothetical protein [Caldilineaceae bacterium]
MNVEDLIIGKLSVPNMLPHVQQRLTDSFGIGVDTASDIERLVKSYCLMTEPGHVLDELVDSRKTLDQIADELGVSLSADSSRARLISVIVERGLGFRNLNLAGVSNYRAKIEAYQRRFLDPQRTGRRRSASELREAGVHCASIIEQTVIDIFALHTKLLFESLDSEQRAKIRGIAKGGYRFGTVIEKLRNLDGKVLLEYEELQKILEKTAGRSWIIRDSTLNIAIGVHRLRSTDLAHERKTASWDETEPIARPIIQQSLKFMDDVIGDHILPRMLLQVRSVTDEWGRTVIMCLTEDDFDQDGRPRGASERFDESMRVRPDECLILDGRNIPFRPRVPCYCFPDDFSLPITQEVRLFFWDELKHFPSEEELGYE